MLPNKIVDLRMNICNNKIMIEKSTKRNKQKHLKTETFQETQSIPFEFGKPVVRLPIISKKSGALRFRYDNTIDRSLDAKDKNIHNKTITQKLQFCLNAQQSILRKYSNNSQLQLLTSEELQLCADKSKKILPKIVASGSQSRQNTQRSINQDFHKRLNRIKSQKKIDSNSFQLCSYKMGSILGRGNYSIVRLCQSNQGKKYAAKMYPKQKINCPQRQLNLKQQISILKSIHHPNIVSFKEHIQTQQNHYIIMELFDNISLVDYIKKVNMQAKDDNSPLISQPSTTRHKQKNKLSQSCARTVMKQILQAFSYIHSQGIAHRDVKLQNVLVGCQNKTQVCIKVIDFGFSCRCTLDKQGQSFLSDMKENKREFQRKNSKTEQEDVLYDYCGTPSYISPQIMLKRGYLARPADVWALGVLLFYLVTGSFPFKNVTQKSDFNSSSFQQISSSSNLKLSPSLILMLKKMLKSDPMARPTVKQLLSKQQWLYQQQF